MKNLDDYFDFDEDDDGAFDGIDWEKLFSAKNEESDEGLNFDDEDDFMAFNDKMKEVVDRLERVKFQKMIDENFDNIKRNGIDISLLMHEPLENIIRLVDTLEIMKEQFLENEEYEKMAIICPILDKINKKISQTEWKA